MKYSEKVMLQLVQKSHGDETMNMGTIIFMDHCIFKSTIWNMLTPCVSHMDLPLNAKCHCQSL